MEKRRKMGDKWVLNGWELGAKLLDKVLRDAIWRAFLNFLTRQHPDPEANFSLTIHLCFRYMHTRGHLFSLRAVHAPQTGNIPSRKCHNSLEFPAGYITVFFQVFGASYFKSRSTSRAGQAPPPARLRLEQASASCPGPHGLPMHIQHSPKDGSLFWMDIPRGPFH